MSNLIPSFNRGPFSLLVDMNRAFGDFLKPTGNNSTSSLISSPLIDIKDTGSNFVVEAEIPGLNTEDIKITLQNDHTLVISGEKKQESEKKGENWISTERSWGSFTRTIELPEDVNTGKIQASYENGILKMNLPKSQTSKSKQVEIKIKGK